MRNFMLAILIPTGFIASCKTTNQNTSQIKAAADETLASQNAAEFRNIFYTLAKPKYSPADVQKALFFPPDAITKPLPPLNSPDTFIKALDQAAAPFTPQDLYSEGLKRPLLDQGEVLKDMKDRPITFVIVPGLGTEVANTVTFNEIATRKDSSLARKFQQALKNETNAEYKEDFSFDIETFQEKMKSMDLLIKAGSYDDADGKPLLNVVFLNAPLLSGESFGPTEENAKVYVRRITKYFRLMKAVDENLYIVGQSRGVPIALDVIRQAFEAKDREPWTQHLKGLISLVGIIYGTPVSDAAFDPKDPLNKVFKPFVELADSLEEDNGRLSQLDKVAAAARNAGRWVIFAANVAKATLGLPHYEGLAMEGIQSSLPSLDPNLQLLNELAFNKFDINDLSIDNHFVKVRKFKWLVNRMRAGVDGLRTSTRLEWWKTHTIPTTINYYAIAAVLPNLSSKAKGVSPLVGNSVSYDTKALDYHTLRASDYQMVHYSGNTLADGLAVTNRSWFWPEAASTLNPNQKPFPFFNLGVADIDHFGIGFPEAAVTAGGHKSPFPRETLALSLAAFVSRHP